MDGRLDLPSELSIGDTFFLKGEVEKLCKSSIQNFAINLQNLSYVDSKVISFFVFARRECENKNAKFCLISPTEFVRDVLGKAGISSITPILESESSLENA